jgi:putative ABC transport system permease protein
VRSEGVPPATLIGSVRAAVAALDADLPLRDLQTAQATIAQANYQWQIVGTWLSFLAAMGLALASLGMYGVISRTIAQRTAEFGIRLALGAQVRDIVRMVLASGARLAVTGSILGLVGAFGVARALGSMFPNIHTDNAAVMAGVTLFLVGVALLASYLPARTASRIDVVETLRAE